MNTRLQKQFDELEKSRKDLFDDLNSYDDDIINKRPKPGAWSIAQVVEHLLKAEESSLIYLRKKHRIPAKCRQPDWLAIGAIFLPQLYL